MDEDELAAAPVAADRPFVDGTSTTSDALREEVDARSGAGRDEQLRTDALRAEVGDTVAELTARLDQQVRATRARTVTAGTWLAGLAAAALALLLVRRHRRRPPGQ